MKTTLNNDERVFQVVTSKGKQAFCNLTDLNKVIESLETHEGYFTIYHFWNNKPKKVNKKLLRDMFEAQNIKQEFYY